MAFKVFRNYAELRAALGLPDQDAALAAMLRAPDVTVNLLRRFYGLPPLLGEEGAVVVRLEKVTGEGGG
jgi:hypothetical protein